MVTHFKHKIIDLIMKSIWKQYVLMFLTQIQD